MTNLEFYHAFKRDQAHKRVLKEATMTKKNNPFANRMRWLADDFEGRAESDDSPELMGNFTFLDRLGALDRMDEESADVFVVRRDVLDPETVQAWKQEDAELGYAVQRDEDEIERATLHGMPVKVIVRRPPENVPFLDPAELDHDAVLAKIHSLQDATEGNRFVSPQEELTVLVSEQEQDEAGESQASSTDAMAYADGLGEATDDAEDDDNLNLDEIRASLDVRAPKDRWDLVRDESSRDEDEHYSADWYPTRADKSLKGYAANLAKAIEHGISRKQLFLALKEANPVSAAKYKKQQMLEKAKKTKTPEKLQKIEQRWSEYIKKLSKKKQDRVPGNYVARLWEQISERAEQAKFLDNPEVYKRRVNNRRKQLQQK